MTSREAVRQVAVLLFARQGFAGTGIRELGRQLGLSSATLYHYTGGKEELLADIMRDSLTELLRSARVAVTGSDDPAAQLARLVSAHVGFCAVNPLTARVTDQEIRALSPSVRAELGDMRDDYESMYARILERGTRTGVFALTDVRLARLALLEMCNGVANWYRPDGRVDLDTLRDRLVEFTCRLVGAPVLRREELGAPNPPVRLPSEPAVAPPTALPEATA
jgi:TetR/AcrR family transcriptional regulator, cholesterol catabolism regulator